MAIMYAADTPELEHACDMLRQIYWREYGRGWREVLTNIKRVLEQEAEAEGSAPVQMPEYGKWNAQEHARKDAEIAKLLELLQKAADAYNNGGEDECCCACIDIARALEQRVTGEGGWRAK